MKDFILLLAEAVNIIHDALIIITRFVGLDLSDKDLHFWIIGILGFFIFTVVHICFIQLAKWSITALSIIYTSTVVLVIVFAIEIQQGITNRGNMDFQDAVYGLWGFLFFLFLFLTGKVVHMLIRKWVKRSRR